MKFIFYIVIITATGWAGWYFAPGIHKEMKARIDTRKADEEKKITSAVNQAALDQRLAATNNSGGGSKAGNLFPPLPPKAGETSTQSANSIVTPGEKTTASALDPKTTTPKAPLDEIDARYPMPTFKTIEEITKDWTAIPSPAFPRKVKTKVPLTFDAASGKVELPLGADARAAGMAGGLLILLREGDDVNRIQVPLANTDLKEKLTTLYEQWKEYRRKLVVKQREHARALKARSNGATEDQMKLAGPKPDVRPGGVIPIMLTDIQDRKMTELKADAITSWGTLDFEMVDGTVYWTGTLQCTVENPIFGPQPTEVMALMKEGKVVKWLYTGSREPVQ